MPLVALTRDRKRICSLDYIGPGKDLRLAFPMGELLCPDCEGEMICKHGYIVIPHFAHRPDAQCTPLDPKPESLLHLVAKKKIRDILVKWYQGVAGIRIELEVPFPDVKRKADLAVFFPNGHIAIHEAQLSPITREVFDKRTADYERAGASEILWWLCGATDTHENREWLAERCGAVGRLEVLRKGMVQVA